MNDIIIEQILKSQGEFITILALRVTVLEELLIKNSILSKEDISSKAVGFAKEFKDKVESILNDKVKNT